MVALSALVGCGRRRRCRIGNCNRPGSVRGSGGCVVGSGRLWSPEYMEKSHNPGTYIRPLGPSLRAVKRNMKKGQGVSDNNEHSGASSACMEYAYRGTHCKWLPAATVSRALHCCSAEEAPGLPAWFLPGRRPASDWCQAPLPPPGPRP